MESNYRIQLANGVTFPCIGVASRNIYYQGVQRDCLTFYFDTELVKLQDLINFFNSTNCSVINIINAKNDEGFSHFNYQIQNECGIADYSAVADGPVGNDDDFKCLFVRMIQTTAQERLLMQHEEVLNNLIISSLEG